MKRAFLLVTILVVMLIAFQVQAGQDPIMCVTTTIGGGFIYKGECERYVVLLKTKGVRPATRYAVGRLYGGSVHLFEKGTICFLLEQDGEIARVLLPDDTEVWIPRVIIKCMGD